MSEDLEEEETKDAVHEADATGEQSINGTTKATGGTNQPSPSKTEDAGSGTEVATGLREDKNVVGEGDAGSNPEEGGRTPGPSGAGENSSAAVAGTSKSEVCLQFLLYKIFRMFGMNVKKQLL